MALQTGDVIEDYPYLWLRQHKAGETEGRKPRPVCVALSVKDKRGNTHLALLPISTKAPLSNQIAIEIPQSEKRRLGVEAQVWLYVSEYNYDIAEQSFYLQPSSHPRKSFSAKFMKVILQTFKSTLAQKPGRVSRQN